MGGASDEPALRFGRPSAGHALTRPHRYRPPVLEPGLAVRDRLVQLLERRWDHPVVAVVAGPGFGKSTVLSQAVAANALAPRGEDRWLQCEPADAVGSHFAAGIARAVGFEDEALRHDIDAILDGVLEHVERTWPLGLALFLEDVHHTAGPSLELLRRLVREAPSGLHLVASSRDPIPGLARLRSHGRLTEIGEAELRLTADEQRELAERHGVAPEDLRDGAGWPALCTLLAMGGGASGPTFELVAQTLAPEVRRSWAEVVATGGGPPGAIVAAQSRPIAPVELIRGLPLVARHADGAVVPHQLWERILDGVLDDDGAAAARRRVAEWMIAHGDVEGAAPLAAASGDRALFRAVLGRACSRGYAGPARDVLRSWLDLLPRDLHDDPEGLLLRGVAGRSEHPFSEMTRDLLEAAMDGFRDRGQVAGEVAAMSEYVYVARVRGEHERIGPVALRLIALDADGHPEVDGPFRLARALVAEAQGDDLAFLSELDAIVPSSLSGEWMAVVDYLRAQVLLSLGRFDAAISAADRSRHHGGPAYLGGRYVAAMMRWYAGRPDDAMHGLPLADSHRAASPVDLFYMGAYTATVDAFCGRVDRADHNLAVARRALDPAAQPEMPAQLAGAAACASLARGDEATAQRVLGETFSEAALAAPHGRKAALRFVAVVHVLRPELRSAVEAIASGGHLHAIALARLLSTLREGGRPDDLPGLHPDQVTTRLPLRWSVEVAARLHAADRIEGRDLAAALARRHGIHFREVARSLADDEVPGARALLRLVAIDGGALAQLGVLGPTTLRVDDATVAGGAWGRQSVRALTELLVLRHETGRDEALGILWPEVPQQRAEANLRVTLAHLNKLLEPARAAGEAPYLLRSERRVLTLARAPHLDIDVDRFEDLLARADAARHRSTSDDALQLYEEALSLWRGEPYQELADEAWVTSERDRLRARFVAAAVHAAEIHLAGRRYDRAVASSGDALQVEPWSERAYRVLVAAHLARGDSSSAQRALERCLSMLADAGAEPEPETQMVARLVGT